MNDNYEDTNYTLYSNGTWTISRDCSPSKIQVTCEDEGIWSENIDCQALTTLQTDSGTVNQIKTYAYQYIPIRL